MGFDLRPKNKDVKGFHMNAFTWPLMLQETGAGYVIGYGAGRSPATYAYQSNNIGSPNSNDGYKVSASEAKMMATVIYGFVSVQRFINKEWDQLDPDERKRQEEATSYKGQPLYKSYWHEDRMKQFESFAEFALASKGFTIH